MQKADLKQKGFRSQDKSSVEKYQDLVLGQRDWLSLIKFELIMLLCVGMPGALGFFLRSKLYPMILGHVGKNVHFGRNITFRHPHKIYIGDNAVIDDNCLIDAKGIDNDGIRIGDGVFVGRNSILSCKDADIVLEDGVIIGFNCEIFSLSKVIIREKTLLSAYCYFVGGAGYDITRTDISFADQDGYITTGGIEVGKWCWIGARVTLLDGVKIGEGAVIGAGAVVREDVPPYMLAAGIPAKNIRSRKPEENVPTEES